MEVHTAEMGRELQPLLIIDDAAPAADVLKQQAVSQCGELFENGLYPGLRARTMDVYNAFLIDIINKAIALTGCELPAISQGESYFSMVTKSPCELSPMQRVPHYDQPKPDEIAVVHFLCGPQHGGTAFYRHRRTGFEYIDESRQREYLPALDQDLRIQPPPQDYIHSSTALFERIYSVNARFNRLIAYRCSSLHSGDIAAGFRPVMDPYQGRFTATAFLRP